MQYDQHTSSTRFLSAHPPAMVTRMVCIVLLAVMLLAVSSYLVVQAELAPIASAIR